MFPSDLQRMAGEATSLLAKIAAGLSERVGGQPAVELLQELAAGGRQLELAQCLAAGQVDRSGIWQIGAASSTVSFLKKETGESGPWVNRRVRLGRALADDLPQTRQAWQDGTIGMDQAAEIMRGVEGCDDEVTADLEKVLAETAPGISLPKLRHLADQIRSHADPDNADQRARDHFARQRLSLSKTTGGWYLSGWLNTEAGQIVHNALEAFLGPPPTPTPGTTEQALTPAQRRALALVEVARQAVGHQRCETKGPARPTIVVTLSWDDLKHQLGVGDVEGGGTMPAAAIRRLACDADILPMTLSGDGQILDAGRSRRTVSPMQRIALNVRDGHCRFDDCERPPPGATATTSANGSRTTARPTSTTSSCSATTTITWFTKAAGRSAAVPAAT